MAFDKAFLSTRYFVIAATIAALVVGGAAAAYFVRSDFRYVGEGEACFPREAFGSALAVDPVTSVDEPTRRTLTWTFDAAAYRAGSAYACSTVGDVTIEPSADDAVHVEARIHGDAPEAVRETEVAVGFANDGGALHLAAYHAKAGMADGPFGRSGASVTIVVQLPGAGAWDVMALSNVGDVEAREILADNLTLMSDVGEVRALDVDLEGNVEASTDVGAVTLTLRSVAGGRVVATSDVEDVHVRLPTRADVGYDVVAQSEVGEVDVRIGETESIETEREGPGSTVRARSKGFADKPAQVDVEARSSVGNVTVTTS